MLWLPLGWYSRAVAGRSGLAKSGIFKLGSVVGGGDGTSGCFVCWVFKLNGLLDVGGPCCQWIQVVSHVLMCVALNW